MNLSKHEIRVRIIES